MKTGAGNGYAVRMLWILSRTSDIMRPRSATELQLLNRGMALKHAVNSYLSNSGRLAGC
jgi:hypothetical protein